MDDGMKACTEVRKWINRGRKLHSKKNGVIGAWFFDNPDKERKASKNASVRKRIRMDPPRDG